MEKKNKYPGLGTGAATRLKSFPDLSENPSVEEVRSLLHELHVYQAELEMQNEELRQAQQILEESRGHYTDLFEFAPVGYFILDKHGLILNVNLTGCQLLEIERTHLINKSFAILIAGEVEEQSRFRIYMKNIFESRMVQPFELKLKRGNSPYLIARLDTMAIKDETDRVIQCRMTVHDITGEKKTEQLFKLTNQLHEEREKLRKSETSTMEAILEAQEKERSRIAADLHDGINPLLSMAHINADALIFQYEESPDPNKDRLLNIISLLENAIRGIKEISANLSPSILKDFGLQKTLEYLCNRLDQTGQIKIAFLSHAMEKRIAPNIELNLYRITQELLNNIIKHASASEVEVQLIRHPASTVLMVVDNGVGFDKPVEILKTNGFGFKNIASRVRLLRGQMDIDSVRGKGTTITIELPV